MYLPAHFEETDAAEVAALMAAFPLACLVAATPEGLVAMALMRRLTRAARALS